MSTKQALLDKLRSEIEQIESGYAQRTTSSSSTQTPRTAKPRREVVDSHDRDSSAQNALHSIRVESEHDFGFMDQFEKLDGEESAVDAERAFKKIVAIINCADKSEYALRERLTNEGFDLPSIDEAIARAMEYGFIDDVRFSEVLIRSRLSQGKGSAGIERELESNGIDPSSIEGWPESFGITYETELDRACSLLRKNPPKSKNKRASAYRKLVQKGYESSIATSASRIACEDL